MRKFVFCGRSHGGVRTSSLNVKTVFAFFLEIADEEWVPASFELHSTFARTESVQAVVVNNLSPVGRVVVVSDPKV